MGEGNFSSGLEKLWNRLLSRDPEQILAALSSIPPAERTAILQHLKRMRDEGDWHPEQRESARIALNTIQKNSPN